MMPQLSQDELKHYKATRETLPAHQTTYHRSETTKAHLTTLRKLWRKGKAFFVTGVVNAPYDGCFHEPNIWLVTPPGCEEYESLNAQWPTEYPAGRAAPMKDQQEREGELHSAAWRLQYDACTALREMVERAESVGMGEAHPIRVLLEKLIAARMDDQFCSLLSDELWSLHAALLELGPEAEQLELFAGFQLVLDLQPLIAEAHKALKRQRAALEKKYPALPRRPDSVVWPLYASGQGVAVDVIQSFSELVDWLAGDGLPKDRESRHTKSWSHWGTFDSFEVHPWGPVSEFPPIEHYWGHAIQVAQEKYELDLPWLCAKCGHEVKGKDESDCAPHYTGYRGNGGIGVFMEGGLCDECFDAGCCDACRNHGGEDHDIYDPEVADCGASLCEWHTEALLKDALFGTEEAIDLIESMDRTECLDLELISTCPSQPVLPGVEMEPIVRFVLCRRVDLEGPPDEYGPNWTSRPIEGLTFEEDLIEERASDMDLEGVARNSRWPRGLTLLAGHVSRVIKEA
jgi:hypothetical protein